MSVGSVIDILLNCCVYVSSVLILLEKTCSVGFVCKFQLIGILSGQIFHVFACTVFFWLVSYIVVKRCGVT